MTIPSGNGNIAVGYFIGTDFQSSASVWASSAGQYIGNGDAGYNTWLTGTAPTRLASVTAVSSNGSGNYRLSVSSPTVFSDLTTGQVLTFADDNNNIPASITVVSSLLIDLSTTAYSSGTTFTTSDAGLFGPPAYTTASIAAQIDAYNKTFIAQYQGRNAINSSVDVVLTNPVLYLQDVTFTASGKTLQFPQANLFGSPAIGEPIRIINSGTQSFQINNSSGGILINPLNANDFVDLFLVDNSTTAGTWRDSYTVGLPTAGTTAASGGNILIDKGAVAFPGYASRAVTGDISITSVGAVTVTKTNGVAFGPYATASTGQLPGTTTNDNAAAGDIAEYITATSSLTALSANTGTALTSISLTGGDYDVNGAIQFQSTSPGATGVSIFAGCLVTSSNTINTSPIDAFFEVGGGSSFYFNSANVPTFPFGPIRASIASTASPTTYWVNGYCGYSGGAVSAVGKIWARRRR